MDYIIAGITTLFIFAYLLYALLKPEKFAFNTAVSFVTNTNWQSYSGESTLSYLVQMMALTVQNFASPAAGIAVAIAMVRGFSRRRVNSVGNFGSI